MNLTVATSHTPTQPLALSTSAPLRYSTFGALYFAQGIPQGLQLYAVPAWMAMHGLNATVIGGYIGICTLPWTFKIVAGPLMDRYSFLAMGRRRPWLLSAQLGLLTMMVLMASVPDPLNHISLFMAVSFVLNCFGAVQDVATDGLAVDITPVDQQARANGVMWGSKLVSVSLTLITGTWAINNYGFRVTVLGLAGVMLLVMFLPSVVRERQGERVLPWSHGAPSSEALSMKAETWGDILFTLKSAFLLRSSLIGSLCFLLAGSATGLKDALAPVFTIQKLGWTNSEYANLAAGANVVAAIAAMVIAGWLADRLGKVRIISIYMALIAMAWCTLAFTSDHWATSGYFSTFVYVIQFLDTFCTVALFATAMNLCWSRVAATQFTFYMVCMNLGIALSATLLGPLRAHMEWQGLFLVMVGLLVVANVFIHFIHLDTHLTTLAKLETDFTAKHGGAPVEPPVVPSDMGESLVVP